MDFGTLQRQRVGSIARLAVSNLVILGQAQESDFGRPLQHLRGRCKRAPGGTELGISAILVGSDISRRLD